MYPHVFLPHWILVKGMAKTKTGTDGESFDSKSLKDSRGHHKIQIKILSLQWF